MKKTNDSTIADFGAALFFLAAFAFSVVVFCSFLSQYSHAQSSLNWPQVRGTVVADASPINAGGENGRESVWYEYAVGGKAYHACNEKFFEPDALTTGQVGQTVKVFYNPKDPQDACLVRGVSSISTARIVAFLSIALCGVIAIFCFFCHTAFPRKRKFPIERERVETFPKLKEWSYYQ